MQGARRGSSIHLSSILAVQQMQESQGAATVVMQGESGTGVGTTVQTVCGGLAAQVVSVAASRKAYGGW